MLQMNVGAMPPLSGTGADWDDVLGGVSFASPGDGQDTQKPVARVLVVTACKAVYEALKIGFEAMQREVLHASHPAGVSDMIGPAEVDLLICDCRLLDDAGLTLLQTLRRHQPSLPVVLLEDPASRGRAADILQHGIARLTLPLAGDDLGRLLRAAEEPRQPRIHRTPAEFHGMLTTSPGMHEVIRKVRRVAPTDATVLITGESGTGKELVARALHRESRRRDRPFVALNCSALPSELIESELFGNTRGAFTGAQRDRAGLFEAAHGGTLFLDEVGDLGPMAQAKVLRALESREITRVGGTKSTAVDVRVVAATNRHLEQLVEDGEFREDLLYRLDVIGLELPPLRDRPADILMLAAHFVRHFAERHGLPPRGLSSATRRILNRYEWPGNIRELRNCMEHALVLCERDEIVPEDLPTYLQDIEPETPVPAERNIPVTMPAYRPDVSFMKARELALQQFDRAYLAEALRHHGGNIARTARAIGLHRQSLQKLLARRHMRMPEGVPGGVLKSRMPSGRSSGASDN